MRTINEMRGGRVIKKEGKRRAWGKIGTTVFSPDGLKVVGYMVKRPDLLWMFKRADKFLALDSYSVRDGMVLPTKGSDSFDSAAAKRLQINLDECLLMENMSVRTSGGRELGRITNAAFDERNGEVEFVSVSDGAGARALIGTVDIPRNLIEGYLDDFIVVSDEAKAIKPSGGVAATAGEATAKATAGITRAGAKASVAIDKGAHGVGKALGKGKRAIEEATPTEEETQEGARKLGKHLKGAGSMFGRFKEEFDKERK